MKDSLEMMLKVIAARLADTDKNFIVSKTHVGLREVSTVELPFDHAYGDSPPQWYETMIFPEQYLVARYETRAEAEAGHAKAVEKLARFPAKDFAGFPLELEKIYEN